MKTHILMVIPEHFEEITEKDEYKRRTVEICINDRDYQVGDTLYIKEFIPSLHNNLSGREAHALVTHIIDSALYVRQGYIALSIHLVSP